MLDQGFLEALKAGQCGRQRLEEYAKYLKEGDRVFHQGVQEQERSGVPATTTPPAGTAAASSDPAATTPNVADRMAEKIAEKLAREEEQRQARAIAKEARKAQDKTEGRAEKVARTGTEGDEDMPPVPEDLEGTPKADVPEVPE